MIKQPVETQGEYLTPVVNSNVISIYPEQGILNPVDKDFDFSLWAKAVKKQMLEVVDKKK